MKRVIALSTAALLGASLFASPVLAQVSVDTNGGASVGVEAGSGSASGTVGGAGSVDSTIGGSQLKTGAAADAKTNLDTGTTAAIGGSFDGMISAMGNNSASAGTIQSMTNVSSVNVIRITDLEGADMDALMKAETDNSASIDELHTSLEGNAAVKAALEAQSVDPSTVVAANVAADGSLTVYVK